MRLPAALKTALATGAFIPQFASSPWRRPPHPGAFGGTEDFVMVPRSKGAGQLHATNMPDGKRLGALYSVKK
jgi:hypothetical protein